MISTEELNLLNIKLQTTQQNIRREYLQHLFLAYFYQQKEADGCFFKGGTALRLAFNSPRFSEDLDFSLKDYNPKTVENLIIKTLQEIEYEGIKTKILEAKETSGGYLSRLDFSFNDEKIEILLQFSKRKPTDVGEVVIIVGNYLPPFPVSILERSRLTTEKMEALLTRTKPRDFYDLYFLIRSNLISFGQKKLLNEALVRLKESQIDFELELKQFLPKSHWGVIRDFKKSLEAEIVRFL